MKAQKIKMIRNIDLFELESILKDLVANQVFALLSYAYTYIKINYGCLYQALHL